MKKKYAVNCFNTVLILSSHNRIIDLEYKYFECKIYCYEVGEER